MTKKLLDFKRVFGPQLDELAKSQGWHDGSFDEASN